MTAGLAPLTDWIIGSPDVVIRNQDNFYDLLVQNKKRPIRLIVYNNKTDTCRVATIVPDLEWGGHGMYGSSLICFFP
jgi:golgi reassembly-stacking protein